MSTQALFLFHDKSKKQPALACPIDAIGASARKMAAFSGFYESPGPPPLVDARGIVPPHCDGHRNGHQSGYILHHCFICCRPGGRRGNTEPVVAQWQRPVASVKALVMLHWEMPLVPLQLLRTATEMACDGGAFIRCRRLLRLL